MEFLLIGRLHKPYGLKGQIKAQFYIDKDEDLKSFSHFYIKRQSLYQEIKFDLISLRGGEAILSVSGFSDRDGAEALKGTEVFVKEEELPNLKGNNFYLKDLLDLEVFQYEKKIGKIHNVFEAAGRNLLLIQLDNGKSLAVPFSGEYVVKVEIKEKRVVLKEIERLF